MINHIHNNFVFLVDEKNLQIIDTLVYGDTRNSVRDDENFCEFSSFISQYKHLNNLGSSASQNIILMFTK
ncbi:unnamed protein product, partial [Rotaria sordida]